MKVTLTEENFSTVLASPKRVLLYFRTDFCGPCRSQSVMLNRLEGADPDGIILAEIDTQEHLDWAEAFGIVSTPTVLLVYKGEYVSRLTGVRTLSQTKCWIKEAVSRK